MWAPAREDARRTAKRQARGERGGSSRCRSAKVGGAASAGMHVTRRLDELADAVELVSLRGPPPGTRSAAMQRPPAVAVSRVGAEGGGQPEKVPAESDVRFTPDIDGRAQGSPPNTLLDYFPEDFLLVIDESHTTVPQIGAMYEGDVSRKRVLVEHGFRLPSAIDNRPLTWDEFGERIGQTLYLSATPGPYELQRTGGEVVEQVIRPTGLIDPEVIIKQTKGQIDDLVHEIRERAGRSERVLVTTLTKKMAEDLTDYLLEQGIRARYLHSEVDTLRRVELLRELRLGEYDVLVGINLLREGLDLPEVSLVSILDADKEGFLRSGTSLIQTIGRAARNVSGQVHMYADQITPSMRRAIDETNRRRDKQVDYNREHGIDPTPLRKRIADILDQLIREEADTERLIGGGGRQQSRGKAPVPGLSSRARAAAAAGPGQGGGEARSDLIALISELTEQMHVAAAELQFEVAARIRDEIRDLKHELRGMQAAGV